MIVEINWWAVVLATASSMVIGFVWYARSVFGNKWAKWVGLTDKQMQNGSKWAIPITIVVSFFTAFVLAHVAFLANNFFQNSFMAAALSTGFWLWLGFTAARFITHDQFEQRPFKLTFLNIAHEFVTIMVMALIIGWLQP